jgi:hypothetical protein
MPGAITQQRSTSRSSSKRPESPIKRSSSARLNHTARSPSPFSLNTSHNEMPTALSLDSESSVILKPAQQIRRRSNRLSAAATTGKTTNSTPNVTAKTASIKPSVSMNGHGIKASDSISELDESPTKVTPVESEKPAVPDGHGTTAHASQFSTVTDNIGVNGALVCSPPNVIGVSESPRPAPLPTAKPKIDWEVPRKALHSSIGESRLVT